MIVHGGPPPFNEEPEPGFGGVLSKLNELSYFITDKTENFSSSVKERLVEFTTELDDFVKEVAIPITEHLNERGAAHGETKATIGLPLKDNYRAATLAEHRSMAKVDAFVTSQGARAAIEANTESFVTDNYQQNDVLQMASYYFPDEYPTLIPTVPEPIRYFNGNGTNNKVPVLFNGDRLVFCPIQPTNGYQTQSLFVSGPTNQIGKTLSQEVQNVSNSYVANGWNNIAGQGTNGKIIFFHPIADKNIYEFSDNTGLPSTPNKAYLLYQAYGGIVYKGIGSSVEFSADDTLRVTQRFFSVTALTTSPSMTNLVTDAYTAVIQTPSENTTKPINNGHDYKLKDFFTLPAGATVKRVAGIEPNVSLYWKAQDNEAHLFVATPIIITLANGKTIRVTLRFVEVIRPGTLRTGGSGSISTLGLGTKDVFNDLLELPVNPQWVEEDNIWNFNSPVYSPGVVLHNGEIVRARSTKYGMTIKRYNSEFEGIKDWVEGPRPEVPYYEAVTETVVPARHVVFTPLPERIISIKHTTDECVYLVYGLDIATGRYTWQQLSWAGEGDIGVVTGNKSGIRIPDIVTDVGNLPKMPNGVVISTSLIGEGVKVTGLAFNQDNSFKGVSTITYGGGVVVTGPVVSLSNNSLFTLRAASNTVLGRAKIFSPLSASLDALREGHIQVYAVTDYLAVYVLTDGLCYAEVGVVPYTITGGVMTLDFSATNGPKPTRVTTSVNTLTGVGRTSKSGDGVKMEFGDLQVFQTSTNGYHMVVTRPYGDLYGDLSFYIPDITLTLPVITGVKNNVAKLFYNDQPIDVVDVVYPSFAIPLKGLYQYDPLNTPTKTNCLNVVNPIEWIDPFDVNEAGWVRVPAGAKVVLGGRAYFLNRDYPVKTNPTGVTYCYIERKGDVLSAVGSSVLLESSNNSVMFGVATNGVLKVNTSYLVLDRHLVSSTRKGSAIPYFEDDGGNGPNKFFTQRDRI